MANLGRRRLDRRRHTGELGNEVTGAFAGLHAKQVAGLDAEQDLVPLRDLRRHDDDEDHDDDDDPGQCQPEAEHQASASQPGVNRANRHQTIQTPAQNAGSQGRQRTPEDGGRREGAGRRQHENREHRHPDDTGWNRQGSRSHQLCMIGPWGVQQV